MIHRCQGSLYIGLCQDNLYTAPDSKRACGIDEEPIVAGAGSLGIVCDLEGAFGLIEFPADDAGRARRFWSGLLGIELAERSQGEGRGWQTPSGAPVLGIHERGAGPGDTAALPYFTVGHMEAALEKVTALGGSVIHPGAQWSICRDSEGSPFGLALGSGA